MSSGNNRTQMIGGLIALLVLIGAVYFFAFNNDSDSGNTMSTVAVIETDFGNIVIEFFPDKAPGHVENFIKLANDGYYDGTTFHRVIPGFMIQGGDPNTKSDDRSSHGQGGPGYTINAEFNDISHVRGIVSMARTNDPNSAGSQFFIVVSDSPFLDKQYTVFGKVVEGMDVADKIVNVPRDNLDNPNDKVVVKRISIRDS
jgi:peptidyl-prolyl cis-trans isomerase B (cyclophilin B)